MRKFGIVALLLLHGTFLTSPSFVDRVGLAGGNFEYAYFGIAVFVYAASFFEWGRARYLLLPFYAHPAFRCAVALRPSWAAGASVFSLGCLLGPALLLTVCWQICFRPGQALPDGRTAKARVVLWMRHWP